VIRGGRRTPHLTLAALTLAALTGCTDPEEAALDAGSSSSFLDAAGDTLRISEPPSRIVALVPSVTRTIVELGAVDRLAGRTVYDTGVDVAHLPAVGAGMGPDYEALVALGADLVVYFVGASDPDTPAQLDRLGLPRFGVRPDDIDDVSALYRTFGEMLGRDAEGEALARSLGATLDSVRAAVAAREPVGVAYLLDGNPPWAAGPDSYIGQLVELAGGELLPDELPRLYGQISPEGLVSADIDVILVSSEVGLDARLAEGRRVETIEPWVEVPGPEIREAAWVIARALHPDLRADLRNAAPEVR